MPLRQKLNDFFAELAQGNPDVSALLVIDDAGLVQSNGDAPADLTRVAVAMTVPLRELLERTAAELGCGEFRSTLVEGSSASLALADVDGARSVVVVGAAGASLGALRADSLWLADQLRSLSGEDAWN